MEPLEQVNDFLTQAGTFYLTTVDGDRPKCRPVAFHKLEGGKLYFAVGDFKEVYRQMQENPNVEVCAAVGKEFLRYYGRAVFQPDHKMAERALAAMPAMAQIYNERTGYQLEIFHLEEATAEFRGMMGVREQFSV